MVCSCGLLYTSSVSSLWSQDRASPRASTPSKGRNLSMIRFLQKDNRLVKSIFWIIISVACITMVITLVPGIFQRFSLRLPLTLMPPYAREAGWANTSANPPKFRPRMCSKSQRRCCSGSACPTLCFHT